MGTPMTNAFEVVMITGIGSQVDWPWILNVEDSR